MKESCSIQISFQKSELRIKGEIDINRHQSIKQAGVPAAVLLRLGKDGAEVLDASVDAVTHFAAVGGLVWAGKHRRMVTLANLLHADLERLALVEESAFN